MNGNVLWRNSSEFVEAIGSSVEEIEYLRSNKFRFVRSAFQVENGRGRWFDKPKGRYKETLKAIDQELKRLVLPEYFYGSRKGCSAVDNALVHLSGEIVIKLDLEKYFPSTSYRRVRETLKLATNDPQTRSIVTELCTFDHALPQGFPTSPTLGELILVPVARRLHGICLKNGFKMSIYIDDIHISGPKSLLRYEPILKNIIGRMGFKVNDQKSVVCRMEGGCEITGVLLRNGVASTTKEFDKQMLECEAALACESILSKKLILKRKVDGMKAWQGQIRERLLMLQMRNRLVAITSQTCNPQSLYR